MVRESEGVNQNPQPEKQDPLEGFTSEQRSVINERRHMLSSLAQFVGKNLSVPVELGETGKGWEGDLKGTKIKADPQDLANETINTLRYKVAAQGGRLRVSRLADIPQEQWNKLGYQYLTNTMESARATNFVAEGYPKVGEHLDEAAKAGKLVEAKSTEKAKSQLGFTPRFIEASNELTKKWYSEITSTSPEPRELRPEVEEALQKMESGAHDAWWKYPTKKEADDNPEIIQKYAQTSRETVDQKVWPAFEELLEKDMEDAQLQEMLKDMAKDADSQDENKMKQNIPQELSQSLTGDELQKLIDAMKESAQKTEEQSSSQAPIDLDSLDEETKQKLKEYLKSLPENKQNDLQQKAQEALSKFEQEAGKEIEGMVDQNPNTKNAEKESESTQQTAQVQKGNEGEEGGAGKKDYGGEKSKEETEWEANKFRKRLQEIFGTDETKYEQVRSELMPIIDKLENDLREIFSKRRESHLQTGFKTGKRIDIPKRIQEKARGVSVMESKSWQRRKLPVEKDYAFTVLIDVTTSMLEDDKILETFKGVVVLSEVLNRLSINLEIIAYNTEMFVFQKFGEKMSDEIRAKIEDMLEIPVRSQRNRKWGTATGWAVNESSARLARQIQREKIMLVLTDGRPDLPADSPRRAFDLKNELDKIKNGSRQKVIGGGIGSGTGFVSEYFEDNFVIGNVRDIAAELSNAIRKIVSNSV